jgi:hypothetical protein
MTAPDASSVSGGCRRWRWVLWIVLLAAGLCVGVILGGLALDRLGPAVSEADLRAALDAKITEAAAVWAVLDDLWRRLESGESVYCSEVTVTRPYFIAWRTADRNAQPALAALADEVNGAIRSLHRAADHWTAVCQGGSVTIDLEVAADARAALERAAAALAAAKAAIGE